MLPLGTQGLTFEADSWNGLGMRSNVSCFMRMTDMPLDRSWRIGELAQAQNKYLVALHQPLFVVWQLSIAAYVKPCLLRQLNIQHTVNTHLALH